MSLKFVNAFIPRIGNQHGSILSDAFFKTAFMSGISKKSISSKAFREEKKKPPPFPYKEKHYSYLRSYFDKTTSRFDENTKIIVVDGSIAVGKTKFAEDVARELDFYHIKDANMDMKYITINGFDMRKFDSQLPVSVQSFDERKFCQDPKHLNVASFQIWMYRLRYSLYVDAIAHLLSTGQGVVIERSPWSDSVFMEAMFKNNYISRNARKGYLAIKKNTIFRLLRPHLIIYLDAPVSKIKEKLKCHGFPYEQNSPALTDQYLQDLEDIYKTEYLPAMSPYAELLMYDWSEEGDVEAVVEDIERIDFESYTKYDQKFEDWMIGSKEQDWAELRHWFADRKVDLMNLFNIPFLDAPELLIPGEDVAKYCDVVFQAPQTEYADGFNPNYDSNLLFKVSGPKYVPY